MVASDPAGLAVALHTRAYGDVGPPVVILHGLLGSHRNWRSIAQSLASDRRVFAVDLRNHGQSPHSERMDYPHLTSDIAALIHDLELGRVQLMGHSLGGKVAMCVALADPELVESLVVVDIAPVPYPDRNAPILQALRALPLAELNDRSSADRKLAEAISEPQLRQFLLTNLVPTADGFYWQANLDALARAGAVLSSFPDFGSEAAFPGPALFLAGSESPYRVTDHRTRIGELFPDFSLRTIDGAGHWPHIDQPNEFLATVRTFLGKC
ncbi:MAG: alpha/beta fold hydrolase [Gammaproteobacteria bacterium]|nr:alpha/beta fold hydrolase [Gammaproteobacteria bacterium]